MSSGGERGARVWPVAPHSERWTDWLFSFALLRLALFVTVVRELIPTLFTNPRWVLEYMDDHTFHGWASANFVTLTQYKQLPMWNPFWCGGSPGIAEPENNFFAPDTLLQFFFDVATVRHLLPILGMVLAAEGTFRVARSMGSSGLASLGAGLVYGLSSVMMPMWITNGFLNFAVGFGLMPWVLWCLLQGIERPGYRYLGGFFFAWIFVHAGTYPAPYTLLLVGYFTVASSLLLARERPRGWLAPFVSAVVLGATFLLLAQAKFLPLMMFLRQFSRQWNPIESMPAPSVFGYLSQVHVPLLVFAGLAVFTRDRWAVVCGVGAALFFVLAMGDFDPLSPYHLLKQLPLFKQLRSPERHVILVMFCVSLCAARFVTFVEDGVAKLLAALFGARALRDLPSPMRAALVLVGTLVAAALFGPRYQQMLKESAPHFSSVVYSFEPPRAYAQPFRQQRGNRRDGHIFPAIHAGSLACITGLPVAQSRLLRGDLSEEEYPSDPSVATVRRVRWTPNEIELAVDARRPTRVLINQNHHRYWRSDVGTVVSHQGLLAIDVPAGSRRVTVRYVDRPQQIGLVLSCVGLLGLFVLGAMYAARWARAALAPFRAALSSKPAAPSPAAGPDPEAESRR